MTRPPSGKTVACPGCDLLQHIAPPPIGGKALCARCGETLATAPRDSLERALACTLAAAVVFIIANTAPLLGLAVRGRQTSTTIIGGAHQLWVERHEITAAFVAFCSVIAPAIYISFMLVVLLAMRRPPAPHWVGRLLRWADVVRPWSMSEVMLLGILVALTKIAQLATVIPGVGMYAVGALMVLLAAIASTFDPREIWELVEWADGDVLPPVSVVPPDAGSTP
jgi:paraquat-inducible protein A